VATRRRRAAVIDEHHRDRSEHGRYRDRDEGLLVFVS